MKHRRVTLLAAACALVACLAVPAGAGANPVFESPSGIYPLKFSLKGGEVKFEDEGAKGYACHTASGGEGEVKSKTSATLKLTFTHCNAEGGATTCMTAGAGLEEIRTLNVTVVPVYTSKAKHEVALAINYEKPESPPPPPVRLAEWQCETFGTKALGLGIRRSILSPVTPVNTQALTFALKFTGTAPGKQTPSEYETEAGEKIKATPEMALVSKELWRGGDLTAPASVELSMKNGLPLEIKG